LLIHKNKLDLRNPEVEFEFHSVVQLVECEECGNSVEVIGIFSNEPDKGFCSKCLEQCSQQHSFLKPGLEACKKFKRRQKLELILK
jgi:hypothetical protein